MTSVHGVSQLTILGPADPAAGTTPDAYGVTGTHAGVVLDDVAAGCHRLERPARGCPARKTSADLCKTGVGLAGYGPLRVDILGFSPTKAMIAATSSELGPKIFAATMSARDELTACKAPSMLVKHCLACSTGSDEISRVRWFRPAVLETWIQLSMQTRREQLPS